MFIDAQRLDFKLSSLPQRYSRRIQQNLAASNTTFSDIQTPGWSSLMKSQISDRTKRADEGQKNEENYTNCEQQNKQMSIFKNLSEGKLSNWGEGDMRKMLKYAKQQEGIKKGNQRQEGQTRDTNENDTKYNTNKKNMQKDNGNEKNIKQKTKRWNQISVHQHLHQDSIKLQNKKLISQIIDQQYKKKQIYKFAPEINKKSIILAQSKFSKGNQSRYCLKTKQQNTLQTQASQQKQKQDKDVRRYKLLNRIFYLLSQGKTLLSESCLQNTLCQLPMPCIVTLQPIITKIYQGQKMEWLDFLENFNSKAINGKQSFFVLVNKMFDKYKSQDHQKIQQ